MEYHIARRYYHHYLIPRPVERDWEFRTVDFLVWKFAHFIEKSNIGQLTVFGYNIKDLRFHESVIIFGGAYFLSFPDLKCFFLQQNTVSQMLKFRVKHSMILDLKAHKQT